VPPSRVLNDAGAVDPVRLDGLAFSWIRTDDAWYSMVLAPRTPVGDPACSEINL
jgi:hypothetical protein